MFYLLFPGELWISVIKAVLPRLIIHNLHKFYFLLVCIIYFGWVGTTLNLLSNELVELLPIEKSDHVAIILDGDAFKDDILVIAALVFWLPIDFTQ